MAAKMLSTLESAVLRAIKKQEPHGAAGLHLRNEVRKEGLDKSEQGCHSSASALVRKGLARRAGTSHLQFYKLTQGGIDALRGDVAGRWIVRPLNERETSP
jgi:hypothetical protein